MAAQASAGNATIYLDQLTATNDRFTENLGEIPFEQVNILGDESQQSVSTALQDIWNFGAAVNDLTTNTFLRLHAKYDIEISDW